MKNNLIVLLLLLGLGSNTEAKRKKMSTYEQNDPICIEYRSDGIVVVRSWGTGSSTKEAIKDAEKNAIETLMTKGFQSGKENCNVPALISEPIMRLNKTTFEGFFSNGGKYKRMIKTEDKQKGEKSAGVGERFSVEILARIDRVKLRDWLERKHLLPKKERKKVKL